MTKLNANGVGIKPHRIYAVEVRTMGPEKWNSWEFWGDYFELSEAKEERAKAREYYGARTTKRDTTLVQTRVISGRITWGDNAHPR